MDYEWMGVCEGWWESIIIPRHALAFRYLDFGLINATNDNVVHGFDLVQLRFCVMVFFTACVST